MILQNIADIKTESGKTYRELNMEKKHLYKINDLVEIIANPEWPDEHDGMRLYIIGLTRDCDETPLYVLGSKGMELYQKGFGLREGVCFNFNSFSGFSEDSLLLIKESKYEK